MAAILSAGLNLLLRAPVTAQITPASLTGQTADGLEGVWLLTGKDMIESNLVDALTPGEAPVFTRSLRQSTTRAC